LKACESKEESSGGSDDWKSALARGQPVSAKCWAARTATPMDGGSQPVALRIKTACLRGSPFGRES
jgi:hypothetical protein